jgi:hypothetical protein
MVSSIIEAAKIIAREPPASSSALFSSVNAGKVPSGLVVCDFAEIRDSTHQVLQFLDMVRTAVEEHDGTNPD